MARQLLEDCSWDLELKIAAPMRTSALGEALETNKTALRIVPFSPSARRGPQVFDSLTEATFVDARSCAALRFARLSERPLGEMVKVPSQHLCPFQVRNTVTELALVGSPPDI